MLRTMREKTKIIMLILAVAFVGWLVFDVGMGVTGRGQSAATRDLGSVNGHPIKYQDWLQTYNAVAEQQRQRNPGQSMTREEQKSLEDYAFEQLVEAHVLQDAYKRRGIVVTDEEVRDAALRFPPEEITSSRDFQTNGRFDQAKWQRFLASGTQPEFLAALEARYRTELPRLKLLEAVTADIYPPDTKLWRIYRDQHDSVAVKALVIDPDQAVADASVRVTPQDMERWYAANKDSLKRPASAFLSYVSISKAPLPVDTQAAIQLARALRDSIVRGADFAEIAKTESADSGSRAQGGELGTFGRGQMTPAFEQAAFKLPIGQVSPPVFSPFGIHLIKVEKRTKDSVTARHILIPIARTGARLDTLEARADSLDKMAAEQTDPTVLDSVAQRMGLTIRRAGPLYQGQPVVLGTDRVPDVGIWAYETRKGETSQVIETNAAYYVFRLDTAYAAGIPELGAVEAQVRAGVLEEKKRATAEAIAHDAERRLASGQTLEQVAQALRLPVRTVGPFARTGNVPVLGAATEAVGLAFRLRVGERSGFLQGPAGFFFMEPTRRVRADSAAFEKQKEEERAAVIRAARQVRVQAYLDALRREAKVVDNRAELLKPRTSDAGQ
ncbi:MAG TPA: peptidylprolyl isomerase [Gemmatimonadales bacterium]|nr:peptidylprolyl isomerase [Gemmatimonadales bacterium]